MSAPFDPRDPLCFGPALGRATLQARPVLPPGGTRRAVADLLADDDEVDPFAAAAPVDLDGALAALFAPAAGAEAPTVADRDGWSVEHRAAVETWWDDGADGEPGGRALARRRGRASRREGTPRGLDRGRRLLVAAGAAAATLATAIAAPLVLRAAGRGELGLAQLRDPSPASTPAPPTSSVVDTAVRVVAPTATSSPVASDHAGDATSTSVAAPPLVATSVSQTSVAETSVAETSDAGTPVAGTSFMTMPAASGPKATTPTAAPPMATARRHRLDLFFVVFDRLCQGAILEIDDATDAAQRTLSALTTKLAPPCGSQLLDAADARIVPSDLEGATVELGERYRMMSTQQQVLAAGQIVLSLGANGVSPVRFVNAAGDAMAVPTKGEAYTTEPVMARDYGYLVTSDPSYRPARSSRE